MKEKLVASQKLPHYQGSEDIWSTEERLCSRARPDLGLKHSPKLGSITGQVGRKIFRYPRPPKSSSHTSCHGWSTYPSLTYPPPEIRA